MTGVGLDYRSAVAVKNLVGDAKAVTGYANDALDVVLVRIEWVRKDDGVSACDNWFGPPLHQYGVTYKESIFHGSRGDREGLEKEQGENNKD